MSLLNELPAELIERMERNRLANCVAREVDQPELDHYPVIKLTGLNGHATWLLTEFDRTHGVFYGLSDLTYGSPRLEFVALAELDILNGPIGSVIDFDATFIASKPLSAYAEDARRRGFIEA